MTSTNGVWQALGNCEDCLCKQCAYHDSICSICKTCEQYSYVDECEKFWNKDELE